VNTSIEFTVYAIPQPAGSKKGFPIKHKSGKLGVAIVDANPHVKDWKRAVAAAAMEIYDGPLLDGPLLVSMEFFFSRPKGHFRTGKNSHEKKDSAPKQKITRPDVLKLGRGTEDALTGVLWHDDSQTVNLQLTKRFCRETGERPRAVITVEEISDRA